MSVGTEYAGKRVRCPKCQATIQVPDAVDEGSLVADGNRVLWKVVAGTKKGGPFEKARVRALVDARKVPEHAFVRDESATTDCSVFERWSMNQASR